MGTSTEKLLGSASDYSKLKNKEVKFEKLAEKYDYFSAPSYVIQLGGKSLPSTQMNITSLEVSLNGDGTASGCSFTVNAIYDHEKSAWIDAISDVLEVGAELIVSVGYVKQCEVFYGYVDDFTMTFGGEGEEGPSIQVTGIDAMGYLMSNREPLYGGQEKATALIKKILSKAQSAGYAKDVYVSTVKDFSVPLLQEKVDDWTFLNIMARLYGASLLVVDGVLIFDNTTGNSKSLITLEMGKSLRSLEKRASLAHQIGAVEIRGRDVNQKPIQAVVKSVTVGGRGKTAVEIASGFKNSMASEYNEFVRTEEECRLIAQNQLNSIAMGFIAGEGQTVGIPELVPGRFITIEGSDKTVNGDFYLTRVKHVFTEGEYSTSFEFKGAKL